MSDKELLASLYRPLLREQADEELRGITQLLGLDAKLVPTARVELGERYAVRVFTDKQFCTRRTAYTRAIESINTRHFTRRRLFDTHTWRCLLKQIGLKP